VQPRPDDDEDSTPSISVCAKRMRRCSNTLSEQDDGELHVDIGDHLRRLNLCVSNLESEVEHASEYQKTRQNIKRQLTGGGSRSLPG
jgi:hypothetical protein